MSAGGEGSDPLGGQAGSTGRADPDGEEPPPILGSWKRLYALVLFNLAALIALFYLFTKWFE